MCGHATMDEAAFQTVADATLTELMERIEATRGDARVVVTLYEMRDSTAAFETI